MSEKLPQNEPRVSLDEEEHSSGGPETVDAEKIRIRAYEIYVERGQADGQDLEDWFQAEREVIRNSN
jgi:hypothetical protein